MKCLFCISEAKTTNHNHLTDEYVFLLVEFLVENSANIKKPNYNGGTCLINSVQSVKLCSYLISKGADVNAKDIQNKTALHYAIQEHRYVQLKLLRFLWIHFISKFIWNFIFQTWNNKTFVGRGRWSVCKEQKWWWCSANSLFKRCPWHFPSSYRAYSVLKRTLG